MWNPVPPATPGSRIPTVQTPPPQQLPSTGVEVTKWGVVKCSDDGDGDKKTYFEDFNEKLRSFLQASVDNCNQRINLVKCAFSSYDRNLKGGFFIRGNVLFENRELLDLKNPSQTLVPNPKSVLDLHILDHLGQLITNYQKKIDAIETRIRTPSSISLVFRDEKGKITLNGGIQQPGSSQAHQGAQNTASNAQQNPPIPANSPALFTGDFQFYNFIDCSGSIRGGAEGKVGRFSIPACSLFDCQK